MNTHELARLVVEALNQTVDSLEALLQALEDSGQIVREKEEPPTVWH